VPEGELRLRAVEVELTCRDLQDGYARKRASIPPDNAAEHLRLAQWCVRHGLLDEAGREIADARRVEPEHPLLPAVERRLQMALEPVPPPPPQVLAPAGVSIEELDRLVRELPPGSVETFTQTIQPLLMNQCATGACHGGQAEKFRLTRPAWGQPAPRRLTQRNLHETLKYVDKERPQSSPLAAVPLKSHGTAQAVFTERNAAQYERLLAWLNEVAKPTVAKKSNNGPAGPRIALQPPAPSEPGFLFPEPPATRGLPPNRVDDRAVQPAGALLPQPQPATPQTGARPQAKATGPPPLPSLESRPSQAPPDEAPSERPQTRRVVVEPFVPADPFDAEIFNRRYFPDRRPPPQGASK